MKSLTPGKNTYTPYPGGQVLHATNGFYYAVGETIPGGMKQYRSAQGARKRLDEALKEQQLREQERANFLASHE